jgi:hypothetical protein
MAWVFQGLLKGAPKKSGIERIGSQAGADAGMSINCCVIAAFYWNSNFLRYLQEEK